MKIATVSIGITKEQVMRAVRAMTINDPNFDPGPWAIWDAEVFEAAANLIRREIAEAAASKEDTTCTRNR